MLRVPMFPVAVMTASLFLAGCQQASNDAPASAPPAPADESVQLTGKQAYELVCAGCHEEGINGAPRTGDREAWGARSWLWEAVLFEHAKQGYMDMPARGGEESLDDATVEMAAEYMLSVTFPNVNPAD